MSSRSNNENGHRESLTRMSGYVENDEKTWWIEEYARVAKLENLGRHVSLGILFARISQHKLKLDLVSLSKYPKGRRKRRDQDPARA